MLDGNYLKNTRIVDEGMVVGVDWDAVDDVKSELYKGHGMAVDIHYSKEAYNNERGTLYQYMYKEANHIVQLVGWNDDYPADNFTWKEGEVSHTPLGNGAWLCKNSWGSQTYGYDINGVTYYRDWGIKDENGNGTGFFWISYYDGGINGIESLTFTDKLADEKGLIYLCYDYLGDDNEYSWAYNTPIKTSNVFYTYCGELEAVSIKTSDYDSEVTVRMYLDVTDSPESGKPIYEKELTIPYAGIHVLYFDEHIPVKDGHLLSVVVEERTADGKYIFGAASMDGKEKSKLIDDTQYGVGIINKGESFLFKDGEWTDWSLAVEEYKVEYPGVEFDNFGIKVFEVESVHEETNYVYIGILTAIIILAAISLLHFHRNGSRRR